MVILQNKLDKKLESQWDESVLLPFHSASRKLYIEPSIGASYPILVHLATLFQKRFFLIAQPKTRIALWQPCMLTDLDEIRMNLYRGPSYQVSVHLVKRFQKKRLFRNWPNRNKNFLWRPCLLTNQDEISNLYRRPYIDASYQVLVHFPKRFQGRFLRNWPIRNKHCLWRPRLLIDGDEMSNLYRGPSFLVSVHLAKLFQKLTNQKQELPVAATFVNWSGRNEQSLKRTLHRCLLTSASSFGISSFIED